MLVIRDTILILCWFMLCIITGILLADTVNWIVISL